MSDDLHIGDLTIRPDERNQEIEVLRALADSLREDRDRWRRESEIEHAACMRMHQN